MKRFLESLLVRAAALMVGALAMNGLATAATPYVITNDDAAFPFRTGVSFYVIAADGSLTFQQQVQTGDYGIVGGFFGTNRISTLNNSKQGCIYASEAAVGDVVGIVASSLTVGGRAKGSDTDAGTGNGIGLAMNDTYLYASFTDSNTIGAFQVKPGCGLAFLNDTTVGGLDGGTINGMAVRGNMLIATYTDGTIESFNITGGTPISNGDKQLSTAAKTSKGATYANSVDITSDGHFAIFGDTSTLMVIEVSDISSGKLTPTKVHKSKASISSSNVLLSPDETLLYVVNTQGDSASAIFFDRTTGKLSGGCTSNPLRGVSANWSYLGGAALMNPASGNGAGLYVAQFGSPAGIAMIKFTSVKRKCTLQEMANSPISDSQSPGLISIGNFPPRSF